MNKKGRIKAKHKRVVDKAYKILNIVLDCVIKNIEKCNRDNVNRQKSSEIVRKQVKHD